jgi:hypothetical protein
MLTLATKIRTRMISASFSLSRESDWTLTVEERRILEHRRNTRPLVASYL